MKPRSLIVLFFSFVLISILSLRGKPNFIFILADDCSYLDMEIYGGPAKTPNINQLAARGMTFSRCYQSAPMCSPTRHALYTGIHPVRNGAHPNHGRAYENIKSVAHYLTEAGYRVVLAGKRHIEPATVFPFEYLQEFADPIDEEVMPVNGWRYPNVFQTMKNSKNSKRPFCLFLCSNEPHGPYTKGDSGPYKNVKLSPQQLDLHRDSFINYLAEITYFDGQVGEIVRMTEQLGIRENTLTMVASEQGSSFPFGKWTCYEIGVASGLVASWPGVITENSSSNAIVEYIDILPTLLEASGQKISNLIEGVSFLPVLKGNKQKHKQYAFSIQTTLGVNGVDQAYGIRSVVDDEFRYVMNLFPDNEFSIPSSRRLHQETKNLGNQELKFSQRYLSRPEEELFNILNDPYCLNNLAKNPGLNQRKKLLSGVLEEWMVSQNDQGRATELEAESRQSGWMQKKRLLEKQNDNQ